MRSLAGFVVGAIAVILVIGMLYVSRVGWYHKQPNDNTQTIEIRAPYGTLDPAKVGFNPDERAGDHSIKIEYYDPAAEVKIAEANAKAAYHGLCDQCSSPRPPACNTCGGGRRRSAGSDESDGNRNVNFNYNNINLPPTVTPAPQLQVPPPVQQEPVQQDTFVQEPPPVPYVYMGQVGNEYNVPICTEFGPEYPGCPALGGGFDMNLFIEDGGRERGDYNRRDYDEGGHRRPEPRPRPNPGRPQPQPGGPTKTPGSPGGGGSGSSPAPVGGGGQPGRFASPSRGGYGGGAYSGRGMSMGGGGAYRGGFSGGGQRGMSAGSASRGGGQGGRR